LRYQAKATALKEMKAKVLKEFRKREAGKGMGKMKWDAQVGALPCPALPCPPC
jgi:hypothetical protein